MCVCVSLYVYIMYRVGLEGIEHGDMNGEPRQPTRVASAVQDTAKRLQRLMLNIRVSCNIPSGKLR